MSWSMPNLQVVLLQFQFPVQQFLIRVRHGVNKLKRRVIREHNHWTVPEINTASTHCRDQCQSFLFNRRIVKFEFIEFPAQITDWMFDAVRDLEQASTSCTL